MSDFKLDNSGDLDLTGHRLNIVSGEAAVQQHVLIRLRFFRGEWFLDVNLGVPYFRDIYVKNPNLSLIRSIFRKAILDTPQISAVTDLSVDLNASARTLSVSFAATLNTGEELVFQPFLLTL